MAFIKSKKLFAILMSSPEGKEIVKNAPKMEQQQLERTIEAFLKTHKESNQEENDQKTTKNQLNETTEQEEETTKKLLKDEKNTVEQEKKQEKNEQGEEKEGENKTALLLVGDFSQIPIKLTPEIKKLLNI